MVADDDDPYVYPGTDVLQNRFGIRDASALKLTEVELSLQRLREPLPNIELTAEGYCSLHRHIFQDIYPWAGNIRTVELARGQSVFAPIRFLARELDRCMDAVRTDDKLLSPDPAVFCEAAAKHVNEINARHPFREGNGRTQRALLEVLASRAGHHLAVDRIEPARWHEASVAGFHAADHRPMQDVLSAAIKAPERSDNPTRLSKQDARRDALRKALRKHAKRMNRGDRER